MPRRKVVRAAEEEEEFQRVRRERNRENNRRWRSRQKNIGDAENNSQRENVLGTHRVNVEHANGGNPHLVRQREYRSRQSGHVNLSHACCNDDTEEHYIGKMDVLCMHCSAKHFEGERVQNKKYSFNDCCKHGDVCIDPLPEPPPQLRALFDGTDPKSTIFFERIRSYNSAFSFASFNANLVDMPASRRAPYCFKIQGQIYYQVNTSIHPAPNELRNYGQLFIVDTNEATDCRINYNPCLDRDILMLLDDMMRTENVFAQSYEMMGEELQRQQQRMNESEDNVPSELRLLFTLKPGVDRRRYNFPRCNEVAAVFAMTANGEIPESYVVIRDKSTKELQSVSSMDPNVEPWVYPLYYPFGTRGWHRNMLLKGKEKRITRNAYTKYRMSIRNEFNSILMGRRLFQQWVVDSYVKVERDRMNYLLENQKQLRIDSYTGLQDHLEDVSNRSNSRIGKVVILPSTYVGSPRNMVQHYQDSMAIVREFGKPDLFITMTCNPQWREIKENLLPGQQAHDRPDICARVFNIKKDYLLDVIVRQKYFGPVEAYVYVIEFQKRGLPHVHLLVTLERKSKMKTPDDIDRYISAEIPDPCENPMLHEIVKRHMIHGPCGAWCEIDGKCSKRYPRSFREETSMDEDGYPVYQRRDNGRIAERPNNYVVDNRHVVPYCPKLLLLFNCHINVEVVSSIKSVKYLYKYVYKGHDAACIMIEDPNNEQIMNYDEIHNYIEARYVGPVEAVWRITSKTLQAKSHSIARLPVHLANEQAIVVPDDIDESSLRSALNKVTMLMEYFELNKRDVEARKYTYPQIPRHYVFKQVNVDGRNIHRWEPRKARFNVLGRMYAVSPSQIELFNLRLLLLTVRGATSFEELRTVNGTVYPSYTATCLALGLVEDDEEWNRAMEEAVIWMMPERLRRLFVRIMIYCQPVSPEKLWENFKYELSEDYVRRSGVNEGLEKAYARIVELLNIEGYSLSQFPTMNQNVYEDDGNREYCSSVQDMEIGKRQYEQLNEKQKEIVDAVLKSVDDNQLNEHEDKTKCFYIDGPGGSGKTFIYTTLMYLLRGKHQRICAMAFTGIAATLLPQGKTVHKTFGLPVPLFADSSSNIKLQSKEAKYLKNVDVFIWDEAPMAPRYALEIIDRTLRDIMDNKLSFGGKIVILGGDFRQLLPIKVNATRTEIINLSIKRSHLWSSFKIYSLTQNMRALPEEIGFSQFLLSVGNGDLNDQDDIIIPEMYVADPDADIVDDIYGELIRKKRFHDITKCAILSARNADVDEINKKVVELLDVGTEKIYTSIDTIPTNHDNGEIAEAILPEYLNSLSPTSLPPHELRLRVNSVVILLRNLSINEGLCNGTRLLLLELGNNLLRCEILTGDKRGEIVFLNRITLYCEDKYPFTFGRRQFPIKLAFAITINKSQGQTFEKIGIDLRKDVFNHGQLYVAMSRVRSSQAVKIYFGNQRNNQLTKNYVYKELYV